MFDSVALDVVIGLVFIYLLYSLLATVLSEIFANASGLREKNLKEAINRMLCDEPKRRNILSRLWLTINILHTPSNATVTRFYDEPEIKYLGHKGLFRTPSNFKAISFSTTLLNLIAHDDELTSKNIGDNLALIAEQAKAMKKEDIGWWERNWEGFSRSAKHFWWFITGHEEEIVRSGPLVFDPETSAYIHSMWVKSGGDLDKFRAELENWFNRTMEHATEWYKRKIQVVLLLIGLFLASSFNADTFVIVKKLSVDDKAREDLVKMASAYMETHPNGPPVIAMPADSLREVKMDSLKSIQKKIEADIASAHSLLGMGGWLPDSVIFIKNTKGGIEPSVPIEAELLCPSATLLLGEFQNSGLTSSGTAWLIKKCEKFKDTRSISDLAVQERPVLQEIDSLTIALKDLNARLTLHQDSLRKDPTKKITVRAKADSAEKAKTDSILASATSRLAKIHDTGRPIFKDGEFLFTTQYQSKLDTGSEKVVKGSTVAAWNNNQFTVYLTAGQKFSYYWNLLGRHFWGFLITAIAISLGAPFWFDLLNKLMRLRTSTKQEENTPNTTAQANSPTVIISNNQTEGAVG